MKKTKPYYSPRSEMRQNEYPDLYSARRPVSVAQTTISEVSDHDIGLDQDDIAQEIAERYIRAAVAYRMKQDRLATIAEQRRVEIMIAAQTLDISTETAQGVLDELERIIGRRSVSEPSAAILLH